MAMRSWLLSGQNGNSPIRDVWETPLLKKALPVPMRDQSTRGALSNASADRSGIQNRTCS